MRFIIWILLITFTAVLCNGQGASRKTNNLGERKTPMFASNEFFAKGGMGIINEKLYIVLKSEKNELRLGSTDSWVGVAASQPELAIVFDGKVWSPQALPPQFDLSRAIIISFEGDKVRFFDFGKITGGYYKRSS